MADEPQGLSEEEARRRHPTVAFEEDATVAQVIQALMMMPPGAVVLTEGCDCNGAVCCVGLVDGETVYLGRYVDSLERTVWKEGTQ
jgi:hypothetical protein